MIRQRGTRLAGRVHTLDSFRSKNFRLLWTATFLLAGEAWSRQVVLGWLTYSLTGSPLLTALAMGLGALPFLIVGPLAGVLADGWDRRKLLAAGIASQAAIAVAFVAVLAGGRVQTWHIFAFILAMGLAASILQPALTAMVPNAVPKERIVNAFALQALAFNITRLTVPAMAGVSIAVLGPGSTMLLGVALLLGAGLAARGVTLANGSNGQARPRAVAQLKEVFQYVRRERAVGALLLTGALPSMLAIPFVQSLMPVYASEVFHVGPAGLGFLVSAIGAGSTMGGIVLATMGTVRNKGRLLLVTISLTTAAMVAFSMSPSMPAAVLVLMFLGASQTSFFTVNAASLQGAVPDNLRGRVSSLAGMTMGLFPLGALLSGGLAEWASAPSATLVGAAVLALIVGIVWVRLPALRTL